jgi:dihydropyrimidinase/allantoinase
MFDLIIKNGTVVFPNRFIRKTDIGVVDGKIAMIGSGIDSARKGNVINAEDRFVFPGIVDSHFHIGIYRPLSEDAKSESASAAAGGVTTILSYFRSGKNYMNTSGPYSVIYDKVLEQVRGKFYTDYGFSLAPITQEHVEEIPKLVKNKGVSTFKFYMFYKGLNLKSEFKKGSVEREYLLSDDPYDLGHLYNIMSKIASMDKEAKDVRLSIHAEDAEIIRINLEKVRKEAKKLGLNPLQAYNRARPPLAERIAIIEAFELANQTGCPINIVHVSSELALSTVKQMKITYPSVDVMVEATPSHLTLTDDSAAGVHGKVNPPIRSRDDKAALWRGIVQGDINTVGSDHACIEDSKKGKELWTAENGYGATELMLPSLVTEGYVNRKVPLERVCALLTMNPAKVHGVYGRKGDIGIGFDADFVIFDPSHKKVVRHEKLHSAQDFTPFEGLELSGWAQTTILRGKVIYDKESLIGEPSGEYLKRPIRAYA